jgi:hypothetical protein
VAELVDAPDSKSGGAKAPCRFEPDLRYQEVPANQYKTLSYKAKPSTIEPRALAAVGQQ